METVGHICNLLSLLGVFFLVIKSLKGACLRATLDGKKIRVEVDEVKGQYQRAALGKASKLRGRDANFSYDWKGNTLKIVTKEDRG